MKNFDKYERQYFLPPVCEYDWAKKDYIEKAPIWCSVDLRDGNQALNEPMSLDEKLEFFQMLVDIGFKEIEVGFPAASETEFIFMRTLIERDMIPDDVTVQVLTQAREHIIKKTFEAVKGAPHAVIDNNAAGCMEAVLFCLDRKNSTGGTLTVSADGDGLDSNGGLLVTVKRALPSLSVSVMVVSADWVSVQ